MMLLLAALWAYVVDTYANDPIRSHAGLSQARLESLGEMIDTYVQSGEIAGAVVLIRRRGRQAYLQAFGARDLNSNGPMTTDAMFSIQSMTKPIVTVATLMLWERGILSIDDPVSKYIPEFRSVRVYAYDEERAEPTTVPVEKPITIRHLLNHTSGISYAFLQKSLVAGQYGERLAGLRLRDGSLKEFTRALSELPLLNQPGSAFEYGHSTEVVGRVLEVVTGKPLNAILDELILEPLEMRDTSFYLSDAQLERLTEMYRQTGKGSLVVLDRERDVRGTIDGRPQPTYFGAGDGLYSTAKNYAAFLEMLLNGGNHGGTRFVSRKTVEMMTSNSIGDNHIPWRRRCGDKYGYGVAIRTARGEFDGPESLGTWSWWGYLHTAFWVDPEEEMIIVFMTQVLRREYFDLLERVRAMAFQAIID